MKGGGKVQMLRGAGWGCKKNDLEYWLFLCPALRA